MRVKTGEDWDWTTIGLPRRGPEKEGTKLDQSESGRGPPIQVETGTLIDVVISLQVNVIIDYPRLPAPTGLVHLH